MKLSKDVYWSKENVHNFLDHRTLPYPQSIGDLLYQNNFHSLNFRALYRHPQQKRDSAFLSEKRKIHEA